jgi:hypothetical protein
VTVKQRITDATTATERRHTPRSTATGQPRVATAPPTRTD